MKLRHLAFLLAIPLASAVAQAQTGVYASFEAQRFDRSGILAVPPAGSSNMDNPWLYGPTIGTYIMFQHIPLMGKYGKFNTGPVGVGIDLRGDFLRDTAQYDRADGLIGLRFAPKKPIAKIVPYVQGSAGIGHTKLPGAQYYTNNWSYLLAVGADRRIKNSKFDWRVIEASAGFLGAFVDGYGANQSNYNINFSTGIVYHLR